MLVAPWSAPDFSGRFAGGVLSPWPSTESEGGGTLSIVSDVVRAPGRYSARCVTPEAAASKTRAEFAPYLRHVLSPFLPGAEFHFAFSFLLPAGFTPAPLDGEVSRSIIVTQWHSGLIVSPPISFRVRSSGALFLTFNTGVLDAAGAGAVQPEYELLPTVARDVWHDFVCRLRFAVDSTGEVQTWHRQGGAWAEKVSATHATLQTDTGVLHGGNLGLGGQPTSIVKGGSYHSSSTGNPANTIYHAGVSYSRKRDLLAPAFPDGVLP